MRNPSVSIAFILLLVLSIVAGCSNHVDDDTTPGAHQHSPTPTMADSPVENQSGISAASCSETRLDEVFRTTRTEAPFSGRTPLIETNITRFVEESGADLKIPGFIPDGFFLLFCNLRERGR